MASGKIETNFPFLHEDSSQADIFIFHCDNKQCQPNLKRLIRELKLRKLISLSIVINQPEAVLVDTVTAARANVIYVLHVCNVSRRKLKGLLKHKHSRSQFNSTNTLVYSAGKFELKPVFKDFTCITVDNFLDIQKLAQHVFIASNQADSPTGFPDEVDAVVNEQSITLRRSESDVAQRKRFNSKPQTEFILSSMPNDHLKKRPKSDSWHATETDHCLLKINNMTTNQSNLQYRTETPLARLKIYDDLECFISCMDIEEEHFGTFIKRSSIHSTTNLSMEEKFSQYTLNPENEQYQKDLIVHIIPELQRTHDVRTLSKWLTFDHCKVKDRILYELEMLLLRVKLNTTNMSDVVYVVENVMSSCFRTVMMTDDTIFSPLQVLTECVVVLNVLNSGTSNSELYIQTETVFNRVHTELNTLSSSSNSVASKQIRTLLNLIEQFSQKKFKRSDLDELLSEPNLENIHSRLSVYELHEQFTCTYLLVNMILQTQSIKSTELLLLLITLMYDSLSKRDKTKTDLYPVLYIVTRGIAFRIKRGPDVYNVEEWHNSRNKMLACVKVYITSSRFNCQWRATLLDHLRPLLFSADKDVVREMIKIFEKTNHKRDKHGYLENAVLKHVQDCLAPVDLKLYPGQTVKTPKSSDRSKQCPRWLRIPGKIWHNMDVTLHLLSPTKSCFLSSSLDEYRSGADKSESKRCMSTLEVMRLLHFREKHSNLVKLLGFQYRPMPVFYLTENHKNLHSFLLETGQFHKWMSWERLCRMSINVIDAAIFLHNKGFVHRNLTTFSFCINSHKTVMLQDFSLTKGLPKQNNIRKSFINDVSEEEIPLHYSAPESIIEDRFDFKTDVWMLGLVIHGIFTHGAFPYTPCGYGLERVLEYVVFQDLKPTQWQCVPKEIFAAIMGCLHTNPEDREDLEMLRQRVENFTKDSEIDRPKRLSTLSEADKMYPPPSNEEPERTLPELFVRLKQELDPKRSYYNMRCSKIRSSGSCITQSELIGKDDPRRYFDDYVSCLRVEEPVSRSFVEEELPQLTPEICTRTLKMAAVPSKLKRLQVLNSTDHEYVLHYKCRPAHNLIDLAVSHHYGDQGSESSEIYYLGLIYNLVKFVQRMHEHQWLIRDICGFSIYVEDGGLGIFMPRVGRLKRLDSRQGTDEFVIDDILDDRYRWLPVEVLQNGLYSKQSDIYMLGMTIWEFYTALDLGNRNGSSVESLLEGKPFSTIPKSELMNELYGGEVPGLPRSCPLWLYSLLTSCWNKNRIVRPTAQHLLTKIKSMVYVHPRKDLIIQIVDLETRQRHISDKSLSMMSDTTGTLSDSSFDNRHEENPYLLPANFINRTNLPLTDEAIHLNQLKKKTSPKLSHGNRRRKLQYNSSDISIDNTQLRQKPGRQNRTIEPSGYYENDPVHVPLPDPQGSIGDTIFEVQEENKDTLDQGNQSIKIQISPPDSKIVLREDSGIFSVNSARCSRSNSYDQHSLGVRSSLGYHSSGTMPHSGQEQRTPIQNSSAKQQTGYQEHTYNNHTSCQPSTMPLTGKQHEYKLQSQTSSSASKTKQKLVIPPIPVRKTSNTIKDLCQLPQSEQLDSKLNLSSDQVESATIQSKLHFKDTELDLTESCQYDIPKSLNKAPDFSDNRAKGSVDNQRSKDDTDMDDFEPRLIRFGSCNIFRNSQRLSSNYRVSYI